MIVGRKGRLANQSNLLPNSPHIPLVEEQIIMMDVRTTSEGGSDRSGPMYAHVDYLSVFGSTAWSMCPSITVCIYIIVPAHSSINNILTLFPEYSPLIVKLHIVKRVAAQVACKLTTFSQLILEIIFCIYQVDKFIAAPRQPLYSKSIHE